MENEKPIRHGQGWNEADERAIYDAFRAGTPLSDIAAAQGRTRGGVRSHLQKLGLLDEDGAPVDPPPAFAATEAAQKRAAKAATRAISKASSNENEKEPEINPAFAEALHLLNDTDQSLFITGKAGTGKSTLLRHFRRETQKNIVVLAPTGVAALNVAGQTIHHFFHFSADITPHKAAGIKKPRNPKIYKKLQTLIIDEISMVRADIMDCIDAFLRQHGPRPGAVFGGVQMIFIGDLYQLPPVVGAQERDIFAGHYETPYFFAAHALKNYPLRIIELEKVYRQKDGKFVALLNRVRDNTVTPADIDRLNSRVGASADDGVVSIHLTTTNKRADEINGERLDALGGHIRRSAGTVSGDFARDYFPAPQELAWKIGAQIMLLTNDREGRWVNGSVGIVEAAGRDLDKGDFVTVRLQDADEPVAIFRHQWEVHRYVMSGDKIDSEPAGSFTQFPFRLAWAVTIHKSQGKTFDRITVDLGQGAFAAGQVYVALSRCTSFEGITLTTPILRRHIRTDARIHSFWQNKSAAGDVKNPPPHWLVALLEKAIQDKAPLDILYRKADDMETRRTIYPRLLALSTYRDEKFLGLKAFCAEDSEEKLFDAARILQVGMRQI